MSDVSVVHVAERSRYEIRVDGEPVGFTGYRRVGDAFDFTHTEIDPAYEGRGLGSRLASAALADVRDQGHRIIASCPFIAAYLRRHPELAEAGE